MHTYQTGIALDEATLRGLANMPVSVTDDETGLPVQVYRSEMPVPQLITGPHGFIPPFQTEETTARVRVKVGPYELILWAVEKIAAAATSVEAASSAAARAEAVADGLDGLQEAVDSAVAQSPADSAVAAVLVQTDTQARGAAETVTAESERTVGRRVEAVRAEVLGGDVLGASPAVMSSAWDPQTTGGNRPAVVAGGGRAGVDVLEVSGTRAEGAASAWTPTVAGMTWTAEVVYRTVSESGTAARVLIQTQNGTATANATGGELPATGGAWATAVTSAVIPSGAGRVRVLVTGRSGDRRTHIESITLRRSGAVAPRLGLVASAATAQAPTRWARLSTPVLSRADMLAAFPDMASQGGIDQIYWPCLVDARGVAGAPGRWLLYWSTNHSAGSGGIGMAYADRITGPWTCLGPDPVFRRTVGVETQTETPHVVVLPNGRLRMFFHNRHVVPGTNTQDFQRTDYADSTDGGSTFVYGGPALVWPSTLPGEPHTGYARVYQIGDGWIAYSLGTGGTSSRQAIWYSADAARWRMDRRYVHNSADLVGVNGKGLDGKLVPFQWAGQWWAAVTVEGANYVARLREDRRGVTGQFFPINTSWLPESIVQDDDGTLWSVRIKSDGSAPGVEAAYLEV